ncbi:MAG: cytochrome c [Thioalkalivibrio sp.]
MIQEKMMTGRNTFFVTLIGMVMLSPMTANADDVKNTSAANLARTCFLCHGPQGRSPGDVPSLVGRDSAWIAAAMRDYRSGNREPTVMDRIAKGYTDDEIQALSDYLGQLR